MGMACPRERSNRVDHPMTPNFKTDLERELYEALERARMWLYLDDNSPYADEETRAVVNDALAKAWGRP